MKQSITLKDYQKEIIKYILRKYEKDEGEKFLAELPTGSGKSIIIAFLALLFSKVYGKKVIISTSTTQLALELYNVFKTYNFKNNKYDKYVQQKTRAKREVEIDVVVGKRNYIDVKYLNTALLAEFVSNPLEIYEKVLKFTKKNKNYLLLLDIFLDELEIDEESKELLKRLLANDKPKEYIKDFEKLDISITNHFYLFTKVFYDKKFKPSDYIILLDETHLLSDTAETISQANFSIYRMRYLINKILLLETKLSFRGNKTFMKNLYKLKEQVDYLFKKYVNEKKTGEIIVNTPESIKIVKDFKKRLLKHEEILQKTEKIKKQKLPEEFIKYIELFEREMTELKEFKNANEKEVSIYYSPARGYPNLSVLKMDYYYKLIDFWKKSSFVTGLSATLFIDDESDFIKQRLGLIKEEKITFYRMSPVFKTNQAEVNVCPKEFPKPQTTEDGEVDDKWVKAVAEYVLKTFENKNTMILTGGYYEAEKIYEELNKKTTVNVMKAERNKSIYKTIEEFKKKGGILIGTRNYGTGIDLKGKTLEKLYVTKLPFPVISTKKWNELIRKDKLRKTNFSYFLSEKEMLLNLKQYIGRLIRSEEDTGEIYILDSRIHKNGRMSKLKKLLTTIYH